MQTIALPPKSTQANATSSQTRSSAHRAKSQTLTPLQRYGRRPLVLLTSKQAALPLWLKVLISLKEGVALTLLLSVVGVLGTYKWMADVQHQWGENYQQLRQLERKERQLMGANENLRNHFADARNHAYSDLVPIDPTKALFIHSSPTRPKAWVDTQRVNILSLPASY